MFSGRVLITGCGLFAVIFACVLASMEPEEVSTPELGANVSVFPRLQTCETRDDRLHTTSWLHDASHVGVFRKDQKGVSVRQRVWQRVSLWQVHKALHINLVYNSSWTLESGSSRAFGINTKESLRRITETHRG